MTGSLQIRPRFRLLAKMPPDAVLGKIKAHLTSPDAKCTGMVSNHHAMLRMPDAVTHYWSPRLTVQVDEHENGTMLRCLFGPAPTVWTLFIAIYAAVSFCAMVSLIWGSVQLSLGMDSDIIWLSPLCAAIGFTAWLVAGYGQTLGKDQMTTLRQSLFDALGDLQEADTDS